MDKRIIFFDIDGTLSDEETGVIPSSTIKAIHQARENGHICIVNTGRPASTIDKAIKDIGFDGFICGCGTYIEYHDQVIFHTELNELLREDVIHKIVECHMEAVLEGKNGMFFLEDIHFDLIKKMKEKYTLEGFNVQTYNKNKNVVFDKFTAWYDEYSLIEQFKEYMTPNFEVIQRASDFIEVVPKGYSKATGIQYLTDYLHMTHDQTISIGDSTNDLPMLKYTKESIAMGNSHPVLFDLVTYQTTNILDNGIEKALKHFHIID